MAHSTGMGFRWNWTLLPSLFALLENITFTGLAQTSSIYFNASSHVAVQDKVFGAVVNHCFYSMVNFSIEFAWGEVHMIVAGSYIQNSKIWIGRFKSWNNNCGPYRLYDLKFPRPWRFLYVHSQVNGCSVICIYEWYVHNWSGNDYRCYGYLSID